MAGDRRKLAHGALLYLGHDRQAKRRNVPTSLDSYNEILKNKNSITGQYLSHKKYIEIPKIRRLAKNGRFVEINGACGNNLNNVDLKIPIGSFTCVTGVSGSGKSTLILQTLYHALNLTLNNKARKVPKAFKGYKGVELIDKIIDIDQSPIGRTPRSNPATYTGAFGPIRDWFTALPESKTRGYKPGRFSFNVKGGRCEACEGDGVSSACGPHSVLWANALRSRATASWS